MRNMRIAELLFNRPLMISEAKLNTILHLFAQRSGLDLAGVPSVEMAEISERERRNAGYTVRDGVGIIGIHGPIMHRVLASEFPSGGPTAYSDIRRAFDTALADDGVKGIVLDLDSPGGEVHGCFDLGDHIYASRGIKPITAVINEQACSACYLLGSAAEKVVIPRTGIAGSIGVIATHTDFSKWEEDVGITVTHIYAGARKADLSPHQPLSEDARARLQEMVDDTYLLFVETVARNRGLKVKDVVDTEAAVYEGKKAVKAKLADEVSAVDKAIASASKGRGTRLIAASAPSGATEKEKKTMTLQELREQHPDLVALIETQAREGMITLAAAETQRTEAVTAETGRVMGVVSAVAGEEAGKKLSAIVGAGLNADQVKDLGLSLDSAGGSGTQKQMLDAITAAAAAPVQGAKPQGGEEAERKAAASAIAAGGSR